MLPRERVIHVINRRKPDRIPLYGWVGANLGEEISQAFGSVEAFEDRYEFDLAHLWPGVPCYSQSDCERMQKEFQGAMKPRDLLEFPMADPDDEDGYVSLAEQIRRHKVERGRFVYAQTPGFFEAHNGFFGIENHLAYLLMHEDDLHEVYRRQAEWTRRFAVNCLELGVDMVHVSDDWGAQNGLMFSAETWWRLIYPYHKTICDAVRRWGGYVSLHSDGNNTSILDGIVKLGYDVFHPHQESAGMDLQVFRAKYMDRFTVLGGLDIQTTLGFGRTDFVKAEIERVLRMFPDRGLMFCTSHFVQNHCSIKELTLAYDTAYTLCREVCRPRRETVVFDARAVRARVAPKTPARTLQKRGRRMRRRGIVTREPAKANRLRRASARH
ncbi:MAG TPA: uroporphyrinogen decarboxylase family protein [Sumerlaeia bacterium]|nr:uroporphyrinogen decarboxylase family protein [Sumerlaeia bacterium]